MHTLTPISPDTTLGELAASLSKALGSASTYVHRTSTGWSAGVYAHRTSTGWSAAAEHKPRVTGAASISSALAALLVALDLKGVSRVHQGS